MRRIRLSPDYEACVGIFEIVRGPNNTAFFSFRNSFSLFCWLSDNIVFLFTYFILPPPSAGGHWLRKSLMASSGSNARASGNDAMVAAVLAGQ